MLYYMPESQKMDKVLENLLENGGGIVRTEDAIDAGFSRMTLVNLVRRGELERVAHGVYSRAGEIADDLFVLQLRSDRLVFSHETALWLNGLSDRAPLEFHITVPTGAPLGRLLRGVCCSHYVRADLFGLGMETRQTSFGHEVRCYNAERTICDMVRNEDNVGVQALVDGLRQYAARKTKDAVMLMDFARRFKVEREISKYMGVLT